MTNRCTIKYIHLADINPDTLHTTEEFEFKRTKQVVHSSYEELEQRVVQHCPYGFACLRPIALRHEVLWRMMLKRNGKNMVEVDELLDPIFAADYGAVHWNWQPLSVCVHIEPEATTILME